MAQSKQVELALQIKTTVDGLKKIQGLIDEIESLGGNAGAATEQGKKLASELSSLTDQARLIEEFKKLKTVTGETGDKLAAAQKQAQALGQELATSDKPTKKMTAAFDKARAAVNRLQAEEQQQVQSLQKVRTQLSGTGIDTRKLADAQVRIRKSTAEANDKIEALAIGLQRTREQAQQQYKDPTKNLRKGANAAERDVTGLGASLKSVRNGVIAFVGAATGITLVKNAFRALIRTGSEMETLRKQLNSLLGSAEKGDEAFKWVRQFAKDTPFQIQDVTQSFITLRNFGLDPTSGVMQAVADQAAQLGGKTETLNGITLALGQAWARGRLQGQDMLQMINQGVPVYDLLAKVTGKSAAEVQKLSEKGELGRDVMQKFIAAMGAGASGASAAQINTFTGQMSNLQDNITQLLDTVARRGVLDYFKTQLANLNRTISDMASDGRLAQYAQNVSDTIVGASKAVAGFVKTVYDLRGAIATAAEVFLTFKAIQLGATVVSWAEALTTKFIPALVATDAATAASSTRIASLGARIKALPRTIKIGFAVVGLELVYKAGEAVAGYIQKIQEAKINERFAAQNEAFRAHMAQFAASLAQQFQQFADVRVKSAEALRAMTLDELEAYRQQVTGAQELARHEQAAAAYRGEATDAQAARVQALATAQASVTAAVKLTQQVIETGLSPATLALTKQFDALTTQGKTTAEALSGILDGLDIGSSDSVQNVISALQQIVKSGKATGAELDTALAARLKKLSAEDFPRLAIAARAAFGGMSGDAQALATVLDASLDAQLKALGVDITRLKTGMTDVGTEANRVVQAIVQSTAASSAQITAAFDAALGRVSTGAGLRVLKDSLKHAFDEGKLSAQAYRIELDKVEAKYAQLPLTEKTGDEQRVAAAAQRQKQLEAWAKGLDDVKAARQSTDNADKTSSDAAAKRHSETIAELGEIKKATQITADATAGSTSRIAGFAGQLYALVQQARSQIASLSQATLSYFDGLMGATGAPLSQLDQLRQKFTSMSNAVGRARSDFLAYGTSASEWFRKFNLESTRAQAAFYGQAVQAAELADQVERTGFSSEFAARSAERAAASFNLLGDQQLAPLRQAIAAARQQFEALSQSIQQQTNSLRDQLDQLKGDQASIEQRRYQEQQAQLEAQAAQARQSQNAQAAADANENLQLAQKIHNIKMRNIEQEASAQKTASLAARANIRQAAPTTQASNVSSIAPARTVRLQFAAPGHGTVSGMFDEGEAERLIDLLQTAGARTVQ